MEIKIQDNLLIFIDPITHFKDVDALFQYYLISRKKRYFYYQKQLLTINHITIKQNKTFQEDDIFTIILEPETDSLLKEKKRIHIAYEDELCLIVNKPANLLVHPDGVNQNHTLDNQVKNYYLDCHIDYAVRHLHRLDYETSGLLMYCKIPFFQAYMDELLAKKKIQRQYLAVVEGKLTKKVIEVSAPIGRHRHDAKKQIISKTGKSAHTTFYLKKYDAKRNLSLVECHLSTGRTHQIRVHLQSIHHSIASDPLYGKKHKDFPRLALHAYKMKFYHPILQKELEVTCPLPKDMNF